MLDKINWNNNVRNMKEFNIDERLEICKKCPLYSRGKCNSNLWLNPFNDEVSTYAKPGFIRGCGCIISVKARSSFNHCIVGKW